MADGRSWNFPLNLNTFEQFVDRAAKSTDMEGWLESNRVPSGTTPTCYADVAGGGLRPDLHHALGRVVERRTGGSDVPAASHAHSGVFSGLIVGMSVIFRRTR